MIRTAIRQGDVFLVPIARIPKGARLVACDRGRVVLAYGEVTGHSHAIAEPDAELLERSGATAATADRYLRLRSRATLVHEEHAAVAVAPGTYRVVIGEEWSDSMEPVRVVD